jgi:hypothetical protein
MLVPVRLVGSNLNPFAIGYSLVGYDAVYSHRHEPTISLNLVPPFSG